MCVCVDIGTSARRMERLSSPQAETEVRQRENIGLARRPRIGGALGLHRDNLSRARLEHQRLWHTNLGLLVLLRIRLRPQERGTS